MIVDAIAHKVYGWGDKKGIKDMIAMVTILSPKEVGESESEFQGLTNKIKYLIQKSEQRIDSKIETAQAATI